MASAGEPIARSALAGQWYAGSERSLRQEIRGCFEHRFGPGETPPEPAPPRQPRTIIGLVSPHAGVAYSGPAAAHGYLQIAKQGVPDVVVVIGLSHSPRRNATIIHGSWDTPLGPARINEDVAEALMAECDWLQHAPHDIDGEQSVELQLPFLKFIYGDQLSLVPVMLNDQSYQTALALGDAIARALDGLDAVIVGSSDLSHEYSADVVAEHDPLVIERILALDPEGLSRVQSENRITMCGHRPVVAMLTAAKSLGAASSRELAYYTSADIAGAHGYVVGYLSAAVDRP